MDFEIATFIINSIIFIAINLFILTTYIIHMNIKELMAKTFKEDLERIIKESVDTISKGGLK